MSGRARQKGRARRRPELSQHFIKSASIAQRLVAAAGIKPGDLVIEAGPGNGALTVPLADAASRVIAIELDCALHGRLQSRIAGVQNVTLRCGDFLSYSLPTGPYTFFANIPFARTADFVRKLTTGSRLPDNACIITEASAAGRFLGQPFSSESALSISVKLRFEPTILAWLGPNDFSPPPSVNSVLLRLAHRNQPFVDAPKLREFDRFSRSAFRSSFSSARNLLRRHLPSPQVRSLINELGFPASAGPSNIAFEHWQTLFNLIEWNRLK